MANLWLALDDIPEEDRCYSADRRYVLTFWQREHREDRYEEKTVWRWCVYDAFSKKRVQCNDILEETDHANGTYEGYRLTSVKFSEDGSSILLYSGKELKEKILFEPKEI